MNLKFAVLSFCDDLTDPKSRSRPIAVAGTGRLDEQGSSFWFYVIAGVPAAGSDYDETSRDMLNSLPLMLQRQLVQAADVSPDRFVSWLHDRFRNSLHVSAIEERQEALADFSDAPSVVLRLYLDRVRGASQKPQPAPRAALPKLHVEPFASVPA